MSQDFSYETAYSRNIGWVTHAEQQTLRGKRVAIAGMGGVGGVHLLTLVRLGVGAFHIADMDTFGLVNFNRQVGASMSTLDRPKVEVLAQMARDINPEVDLTLFPGGVDAGNIDSFLAGVDLYVDGLDFFAFGARELTFAACAAKSIPATTVAPLGMGAGLLTFMPGGMTFEQYVGWAGQSDEQKALRFLIGLAPAGLHGRYLVDPSAVNFAERRGPSTFMACQLCAGIAATEALKILLGRGQVIAAPRGVHFDAFRNKLVRTWRPGGHRHPVQRLALAVATRRFARVANASARRQSEPTATAAVDPPDRSVISRDALVSIARAGVLAPSADNSLQYQFRFGDVSIDLIADDTFVSDPARHRRMLSLFAFGAVAENMLLRGHELGFEGKLELFPAPADPRCVARLTWSVGDAPALAPLAQAIERRHTNRHLYRGDGPSEAQRQALAAEVASVPGCRLLWLTGEPRRQALRLVFLAESERFRRERLHRELFASIRFDLDWRQTASSGLPPAALEVEPPMRPLFKALRHWPLMRAFSRIGGHRVLGLRAGWLPCWQAPALGVVTVDEGSAGATDRCAVAAGRGFERLWLRATLERLVMQPMAASTAIALQDDADPWASPPVAEALRRGWSTIVGGDFPLMLFRMGGAERTRAATVKTGRGQLEDHLWSAAEGPAPG